MRKEKLNVPKGIRYISEWTGFSLPEEPCILNKQLTGCGFTKYCITNSKNVILCSPRKVLLENKEKQHPEVLYVRNELEKVTPVDKDLTVDAKPKDLVKIAEVKESNKEKIEQLKLSIINYVLRRRTKSLPIKILVTYDSFRLVKEALGSSITDYYVVIDEFQSIFIDSKFKSDTEIGFLGHIQDLKRICFVSATPMIDKYLDMLDEFKDLPYYELDWSSEDPGRIDVPNLEIKPCTNIITEALNVIEGYKIGKTAIASYVDEDGVIREIQSKECVIYVNSVKNICDIIKKAKLTYEETNVICARTPDNEKKIKQALKVKKRGVSCIGEPPLEGEPHKMFTFCTRTVYLGADFYSTNAQTFIFSDANIDCLVVDISLDLPQILGRQRLETNPWKNYAKLYYKTLIGKNFKTKDDFDNYLKEKISRTNSLLKSYEEVSGKHVLAEEYRNSAKIFNYKHHYVAVNEHGGDDLFPVFNNLVMISEMRCFEIQQIDYKNRFSVYATVTTLNYNTTGDIVMKKEEEFCKFTTFIDKMKFACDPGITGMEDYDRFVSRLPMEFRNYLTILGKDKIKALSYQKSKLEAEYNIVKSNSSITKSMRDVIYEKFTIGEKYTLKEIKESLGNIYKEFGYKATPKATDLERYFETKPCRIMKKGVISNCLGLIKRKEK